MSSILFSDSSGDRSYIHKLVLFCIGFFLLTSVLTALFIIPQLNSQIESEYSETLTAELDLEAKLFNNYLDSKRTVLLDLSSLPSLANAALMSDATDQSLIDLIDNVVIGGKNGRLVIQDIGGTVLIKSPYIMQGQYLKSSDWINKLVEGDIPYYFRLLGQNQDQLLFQLSVPILYKGSAEGVLSAEITTSLSEIFVAQSYRPVAFRLKQDTVVVNTDVSQITHTRQTSKYLKDADITFTYITDEAIVSERKHLLRNTISIVLLASLAISFTLLVVVEYVKLKRHSNDAGRVSRLQAIPITIALVGVAASLIAFITIKNNQHESTKNALIAESKIQILDIRKTLSDNINILQSTKTYFEASQFVDQEEFGFFTSQVSASNTSIKKMLWAPKVSLADGVIHENDTREDGIKEPDIKELQVPNVPASTSLQGHYFPIRYVEPLQGNEAVLDQDIALNTELLSIFERGGASNQIIAFTSPISTKAHGEKTQAQQPELLILSPVYKNTNASTSASNDSADNIKGFTILALNIEEVVSSSLSKNALISGVHIQDITDTDNPTPLYGKSFKTSDYSYDETFDVAGRIWRVAIELEAPPLSMWWVSWAILLGSLIFTALTTVWLVQLFQRRETVEALATKLGALNLIIANSNDVFMTIEASRYDQNSKHGEIAFVNEAFTRLTGYTRNEAIGSSPSILFGKELDNQLLELSFKKHTKEEPFVGELTLFKKNEESFWADINISPITDAGGVNVQYAVVIRDISDRIMADEEREKLIGKLTDSNEELARSNRELDEFAYTASHDLKEPLRGIAINANFLSREDISAASQKRVDRMVTLTTRMEQLISDILFFSKLGRGEAAASDVDPVKIIAGIKVELRDWMNERGGQLMVESSLPHLHAERSKIKTVFQNLIVNGLKYNRSQSRTIKIGYKDKVMVNGLQMHSVFTVTDNGIGIESTYHDKIFRIFSRLNPRADFDTNDAGGTGAGLSFVRKIIETYGGKITFTSQLGEGTTFYFTLPKATQQKLSSAA